MKRILIPTVPEDEHAYAVAHVLRLKGAQPTLWLTPDFPTRSTESIGFSNAESWVEIRDIEDVSLPSDFDVLWNRRAREEITEARLHAADRGFARIQCARFRTAFLSILSDKALARGALCVNPWANALRTENKLWQHHVAAQAGLRMPESLYTNDPGKIRQFLEKHEGTIAYKPFLGALWNDGEYSWGYFTNAIREEHLVADELLRAVPGIYQRLVPKAYELRVTIIGKRAFAVKLDSQSTSLGKHDWRRAYEDGLSMTPFELPEEVRQQCLDLLKRLGLVFGCLDFIVTPDEEYVFLEVNQAGQFLFVEQYSGLPLLDAFCEFLLQGSPDFEWVEGSSTIRLADIMAASLKELQADREKHVASEPPEIDESASGLR
ncbi:MAG TPA: hypothetical protein VH988_29490 [Thermoanaerobaculia bacterium]|jgi:glutathione synthase/RimK-type ligase-like ATP-grasp enzyme|nr:hypothetical protein [Thermoanaerobaculia bacterium]